MKTTIKLQNITRTLHDFMLYPNIFVFRFIEHRLLGFCIGVKGQGSFIDSTVQK